ncbi:transcriptional regulator [Paractinoplanes tereljensis]|uniref:Transcriptional regulator n=2 Tax=Paractinoplanes tereljensis TaxID=571912 RepID=A0A919NT63_9ACTN|nr:transcriptional regulator [Actinoplanes tereljensis]
MIELGMLICRDRELADLTAVVDTAASRPVAVLLLGDAGLGKTALLAAAAAHARGRGYRVIAPPAGPVRPFGLLRRLVAAARVETTGRPRRILLALNAGQPIDPADERALLTAVLLVLDRLTERAPLMLLVDDAHRADRGSLRLLTQLVRHASAERFVLLLAARPAGLPAEIGPEIAPYHLAPLPDDAAARLLDTRPAAGPGPARRDILRRAGGNPLALLRLADPVAEVPGEFTRRVEALPAVTRRLLLHAAIAADSEPAGTVTRAAGGADDLRDWLPAEHAGLVGIVDGRVRFRHPLIRLAAAAGDVASAHGNLAARTDDPHHRAWHRAAGTDRTDETIAAALDETAELARRHADYYAEARALQAAAEGSPGPADAARRYARAVFAAYRSGDPRWAVELYERAAAVTGDPDILGAAAGGAGLALCHSGEPARAFELTRAAVLRRPGDGQVAMTVVAVAATAALLSGDAGQRRQLPALLDLVGDDSAGLGEAMIPRAANPYARASVMAIADPDGFRGCDEEPDGTAMTGLTEVARMLFTGTVAWLRDDSARAAAELSAVFQAQQRAGAPGSLVARLPLLITALIDGGRWAEAQSVIDEAGQLAAAGNITLLRGALPALRDILIVLRNDRPEPADAPPLAPGNAFVESLRRRAAGLTALAAGDHPAAYRQFRALFDAAGEPVHYVLGPRSLPQLALTAVRTGRTAEATRILHRCREQAGAAPTSRMVLLLAHAAALLDDGDRAEEHFRAAVGDRDRAMRWPLEFAEAEFSYALWLRRQRRLLDARPHLMAALDTFLRLGAGAHAEQAGKYLPAAGVPEGAFAALTPQKQMIARLAATGLTNREIADRLTLSPRTVGSHLYDIYPQLSVGNRHQLRELLGDRAAGSRR